jgi:hypothetical protein
MAGRRRGMLVAVVGCALALGAFVPAAVAAPTEHVTNSLDDGNPGSLRYAVANVDLGGNIVFDSAAAQPALSTQIPITKSMTITGLGGGTTTISGSATSRVFNLAPGITVTIQDLAITGGNAPDGINGTNPGDSGGPGEPGGAILNTHADTSLTLTRTRIHGNNAGTGGTAPDGDMTHSGGPGGAGGAGGAIWSIGTVTIQDSEISGNHAGSGGASGTSGGPAVGAAGAAGGNGGAIDASGNVTVSNSTIDGNLAGDGSAGQGGSTCGAGGNGGNGGGLRDDGGTLTLTNVTIQGNTAGSGDVHGSCAMQPNQVGGSGGSGGGLSTGATATVTNATIAGNTAGAGQPGTNFMGTTTPAVNGTGGGVSGAATLQNTIVSSNNAPGNNRNCDGSVLDGNLNISFPDVPESGCPAGFTHGDPLLGTLTANGGPTLTMAITSASSAFDHVPSTGANCPATDQRGVTRPQFTRCDAGAFELAPSSPPPSGGGGGSTTPPTTTPGETGQRAAALKKCKKKKTAQARKKCKRKANALPV